MKAYTARDAIRLLLANVDPSRDRVRRVEQARCIPMRVGPPGQEPGHGKARQHAIFRSQRLSLIRYLSGSGLSGHRGGHLKKGKFTYA